MFTETSAYLKSASLQIVVKAMPDDGGEILKDWLAIGNSRSNKFTITRAEQLCAALVNNISMEKGEGNA